MPGWVPVAIAAALTRVTVGKTAWLFKLHALGAQPDEGGRVLGGDGVGPEPVHHEDEDPPPGDRH